MTIKKDSVSMAWGAKALKEAARERAARAGVTSAAGWIIGRQSVPRAAARERAAEREVERAVAAQLMVVIYVEGNIINPIVPTTQTQL